MSGSDDNQPLPGKAASVIDEVVVHDPAQPAAWLLEFDEFIHAREDFEQHILEQVLCLRLAAGKTK